VSGTKDHDLYVGFVETENATGVFGAWSDSPGTGTPTDTGATASTTISSIRYVLHAATQTVPLPSTVGFAEAYLPAGNYAGGMVALTFTP
jgi:hypothetical protein